MSITDTQTWYYSTEHKQPCKLLECQSLWGNQICRVWLPDQGAVVRVAKEDLTPLEESNYYTPEKIVYIAMAAKVADAVNRDVLMAPIESNVIPLPHQINALSRAVSGNRVRYLLADEVGLGKTIEAGLIMRELKIRGLVRRILVVAPRGIAPQWVAEMDTHFNETFSLIVPGDFTAIRRVTQIENIWKANDQVVCPMDSVKPLEGRRGWDSSKIDEYNRDRFHDIVTAGWDMIIVDEAHRLGGSTEQVARYRLGQGLAEAAPYFLLLSATPHQGKTDSFRRILSLIDNEAFPDEQSITRENVQNYVIRTEKRQAIKADGSPLFLPRKTKLQAIAWEEKHNLQRLLYEGVSNYVREGYNRAMRSKKNYIGFLMLLMQRLVTSSTQAIQAALEKRQQVLQEPSEQLSLFPEILEEEWNDLDGQEQLESIIGARFTAAKTELEEVKTLLELAKRCSAASQDAKAEYLLGLIYKLQQEEKDPDLKILVFTEFVPTQEMLRAFLSERGFSVTLINGSMGMEERKNAQESFSQNTRVLISTDAGGEGLNLQFCHVVINYDIPWNPMRLEQRIGRVDRIGQKHIVKATNFVLDDTVEHRVQQVLEHKLTVIFEEFGVDKTGDVLDSAQAGQIFDKAYINAILNPDDLESKIDKTINSIKTTAKENKEAASLLGESGNVKPDSAKQVVTHPVTFWVERMVTNFLFANGGKADCKDNVYHLTWPNGATQDNVVFSFDDIESKMNIKRMTLENSDVRKIALQCPHILKGQTVPSITLSTIPDEIEGVWSLWQIILQGKKFEEKKVFPLFLDKNGKVMVPTAKRVWEAFITEAPRIINDEKHNNYETYDLSYKAALETGRPLFDKLKNDYQVFLQEGERKYINSISSRKKLLESIGLPEVRNYRLKKIEEEDSDWKKKHNLASITHPDLTCLLLLQIAKAK
ncbi:DEAD/DEAH box helicase [Fibrobacterota bacterium]